jgi:hypothetical protein
MAEKTLTTKQLYALLQKTIKNSGLELTKVKKGSRISYSNTRRVLSLEERKRYVLVHMPKIEFLGKSPAVTILSKDGEDFNAKLNDFVLTADRRGYTYIRVAKKEQVAAFADALVIANEFNK